MKRMGKKGIAIGIAIVAVLGGLVYWGISDSKRSQEVVKAEGIIYYYGEECPHCKDVRKFLDENKIEEKVTFTKKEVWHNRENSSEMGKRAEACGMDKSKIGVPFVADGDKCLTGTPDVIKFFKEKAGIQ